jgi:CBS-domain-containing membrane protein
MKKKIVKDFRPYEAPAQVSDDVALVDLVEVFINTPILHNICVVDKAGKLAGMINRKMVFRGVFSHHVTARSRVSNLLSLLTAETSGEIMATHIVTANETDSVDEVIRNIIVHNIREIPVLDNTGRVLGFITLLRLMQEWLGEQNRRSRD